MTKSGGMYYEKKEITTAMLIAAMSMSIMACGNKAAETQTPTTRAAVYLRSTCLKHGYRIC